MCVAISGTVISLNQTRAIVEVRGNRVGAEAGLVKVKPGDKVLLHAGCILQVLSSEENEELELLWQELEELEAQADGRA